MPIQPIILWSDALVFVLLALCLGGVIVGRRSAYLVESWRRVADSRAAMASAAFLSFFVVVGLLDCLHYRQRLPDAAPGASAQYSVEVYSALDALLWGLRTRTEKTYSAPLATHSYAKETVERDDGTQVREFPRLRHGGAHLADPAREHGADLAATALRGLGLGLVGWLLAAAVLAAQEARRAGVSLPQASQRIWRGQTRTAWHAFLGALLAMALVAGPIGALSAGYHVFGTDKVGQDVLYLTLKSIRTALLIGTLTTLVMLPFALALGILAGYVGGRADDAIQYLYTTLNSIPGVLLIASAVLMMQVVIDTHPQWFDTSAQRADARLLALCFILGLTSWTGLCRLLRGEALKLRELEYVQAAVAFGVSHARIMIRHILPNVMHIVLITVVMDFSGLVLAEAVLSYIGIGVDPGTISFGTMINTARLELSREPIVWWSLAAAFVFMFVLVLCANLFADAVRDAFDPRIRTRRRSAMVGAA